MLKPRARAVTALSSLISFVYSLVRHHNGPGECQPFITICLMSPKWIFNQFTAVGKGDHEWLQTIYMLSNPISVSESVENHARECFLYEVKISKNVPFVQFYCTFLTSC